MVKEINQQRRRFISAAAMTAAFARLGVSGSVQARADETSPAALPAIKPGTNSSFGALKQIDAGVLMSDTPKLAARAALRSFFYTVGPTTFTPTPMSLLY